MSDPEAPAPQPRRIQRQRTKGWKMPANTVYVGRPTQWGNPFTLDGGWIVWVAVALGFTGNDAGRRRAAVALYRSWLAGVPLPRQPIRKGGAMTFKNARGETREVEADEHIRGLGMGFSALYDAPILPERPSLDVLRGKNVACFCPLDQPCHADVLLELANG